MVDVKLPILPNKSLTVMLLLVVNLQLVEETGTQLVVFRKLISRLL